MIYQAYFLTKLVKEAKDHLPTTNFQTPPRPALLTLKCCHGSTEPVSSPGPQCCRQDLPSLSQQNVGQPGSSRAPPGPGRSPPTTRQLHLGPPCSAPRPCPPTGAELHDNPLVPGTLFRLQEPLGPTWLLVPTGAVPGYSLQPSFLQRHPACSVHAHVRTTPRQRKQGYWKAHCCPSTQIQLQPVQRKHDPSLQNSLEAAHTKEH